MSLIINLHEKSCQTLLSNFDKTHHMDAARTYLDVLASALSAHDQVGCFTLSLHGRLYNSTVKEGLITFIKKLTLRFQHFLNEQFVDDMEKYEKLPKKKKMGVIPPNKADYESTLHCFIKSGLSEHANKLFCTLSIMVNGAGLATVPKPGSAKKNILNLYYLIDKLWCEMFNKSSGELYQASNLAHSPYRYVLLDRANPFLWNYIKQMIVSNKYLFKPYMNTGDVETVYLTTQLTRQFDEETLNQCLLTMAMYEYSFITWYKERKGAFRIGATKLESLTVIKKKKRPFDGVFYQTHRKVARDVITNRQLVKFTDYSEREILTHLDATRWIDNEDKLLFAQEGPHDESDLIMLDDIIDGVDAKLTLSSPGFFTDGIRLTNNFGENVENQYDTIFHNIVIKRTVKETY